MTTVLDFLISGKDNLSQVFGKAAKSSEDLQATIDRTSRALAASAESAAGKVAQAQDRQALAANKVQVAQAKLSEANSKYAAGSSQVLKAEGDLLKAKQQQEASDRRLSEAESKLEGVQKRQTTVAEDVAKAHESMARSSSKASEETKGLGGAAQKASGMFSAFTGVIAASQFAGVIKDQASQCMSAYRNAAGAERQFSMAIERFPQVGKGAAKSLETLDEQLSQHTAISKEDNETGQASLAQFGLTGAQIKQLTPLMDDYAAKTGVSMPEAAKTMGMALNGQGRSLKTLGINFKDMKDPAKNFSELTDQLTSKVGGYAEAMGSTASGKTKIFQNQLEETKAKIGGDLVPVLGVVTAAIHDNLLPVLQQGADWLTANKSTVKSFTGMLTQGLGMAAKAIGSLMAFATAHKGWMQPLLIGVVGFVAAAGVIGKVAGIFGGVFNAVNKGREVFSKLHDSEKLAAAGQWLLNAAQSASPITLVVVAIAALVAALVVFFTKTKLGRQIWGDFTKWLSHVWDDVKDKWTGMWNGIKDFFGNVWNAIKSNFKTVLGDIAAFILGGPLIGALVVLYRHNEAFRNGVNNALNDVRNGWNGLVQWFQGIPGMIGNIFSSAGSWLYSAGQAIWNGFINGVESMASNVKNTVQNVLSGIANLFPHSPAKEGPFSGKGWTPYSGAALIDGFAQGALSRAASAKSTIAGVMGGISGAFTPRFATSGLGSQGYGSQPVVGGGSSRQLNVGSINLYGSRSGPDDMVDALSRYMRHTGGGAL